MNKQEAAVFTSSLLTLLGVLYAIKKAKGFLFILFVFIVLGGLGSQLGWALGKQDEDDKILEKELNKLSKEV